MAEEIGVCCALVPLRLSGPRLPSGFQASVGDA